MQSAITSSASDYVVASNRYVRACVCGYCDTNRKYVVSHKKNIDDSTILKLTLETRLSSRDPTVPGPASIQRPSFPGLGIPVLKIRRSWDRLIFNMGIPILVRGYLYINTAPWVLLQYKDRLSKYANSHCKDKTADRPYIVIFILKWPPGRQHTQCWLPS